MANLENQQRFLVPIQKFLKMAKIENLENQHINKVLGIWYNGKFGQFGNQQIKRDFWYPFKKMREGQVWRILKITRSTEFKV